MRDDFVVFIITHKRPDNQITYKTLKRGKYTGKIIFGRLFFTFMGVQVTLYDHEKNKGGSTEQYREVNLYWNYFYPVLYVPSAISVAYGKTGFIKRVRWNNLLPQIINEKWRKGYEK